MKDDFVLAPRLRLVFKVDTKSGLANRLKEAGIPFRFDSEGWAWTTMKAIDDALASGAKTTINWGALEDGGSEKGSEGQMDAAPRVPRSRRVRVAP